MFQKCSVLFLVVSLLFFGCSEQNGNMHTFDKAKLSAKLKGAAFQSKLPSKLPFKVKSAEAGQLTSRDRVINIFFVGEDGEQMGLQIIKGEVEYASDVQFEKVAIGNKKGGYTVNDAGAMILQWDDKGIHYDLTYFSKQSGKELSKTDLIETAKSF
ncbi:hypothetical protein ACFDTO_33315 [Microbacteriaceae bacterium 4G12]